MQFLAYVDRRSDSLLLMLPSGRGRELQIRPTTTDPLELLRLLLPYLDECVLARSDAASQYLVTLAPGSDAPLTISAAS